MRREGNMDQLNRRNSYELDWVLDEGHLIRHAFDNAE